MEPKLKTYLSGEGYHIDMRSMSKDRLRDIREELTVVPRIMGADSKDINAAKFPIYKYSRDRFHIIVPRYYGISKFGEPDETYFNPDDIDVGFTKTLRDKQLKVAEKCINYIQNHGGGLLSVPCGFGKTVCALYIAHRLGLKTLVIVHKSNLLNQWVDRIKEFLGLNDTQIGIIRQNKCECEGKDIVVGMIHTISKRDYGDIFEKFGFVIYDEAHHVACKFFSKTLMKIGAQYTLALTATPYRSDGLIKVMYWFLGGTIYRERMKMNKNVIVKMIYYKSTDKKLFVNKRRWLMGKMRSDTGRMTTNLCKIVARNKLIVNIITHIRRTEPERKILILSGRKNNLENIKKDVDMKIKKDIQHKIIEEDEITSCYYTGDTKPADRQIAENMGDIIFATYEMAHEGLDIKHLNTVILASPKKDIVQAVGRIMRKVLEVGDVRPLIIDIGDNMEGICNWINVRNRVYKKCRYEIENYYVIDDKFITSSEYHKSDVIKYNYINDMIDKYNRDVALFKNDIRIFKKLCIKMENLDNNVNFVSKFSFDSINYKSIPKLGDIQLCDVLNVPKLTEEDFDEVITRDATDDNNIDIERDIAINEKENENERSMMDSIDKKNKMPTRRLFGI